MDFDVLVGSCVDEIGNGVSKASQGEAPYVDVYNSLALVVLQIKPIICILHFHLRHNLVHSLSLLFLRPKQCR
jgi:hypothetical protein